MGPIILLLLWFYPIEMRKGSEESSNTQCEPHEDMFKVRTAGAQLKTRAEDNRVHRQPIRTETLETGVAINILPNNISFKVVEDSHKYYVWRSYGPADKRMKAQWVDLSNPQLSQVRMHGILSNSHRQAARVALSFGFPFYGHYLRQVTIATGGFIFMGDVVHRILTATQYIAPLMANFDPSFSKTSTVQYMDTGKEFVVQWDQVRLQNRESEGAFTFQVILRHTGTICFNYREIPLPVEVMNSTEHPVKVGLSDALLVLMPSQQLQGAQRWTLYEYHRVEIDAAEITNDTSIEFTPLPTCLQYDSCELCLTSNLTLGCRWCNVLQRCSDGIDRHRQEWLDHGCSEEIRESTCEDYSPGEEEHSSPPALIPTKTRGVTSKDATPNDQNANSPRLKGVSVHTGVISGIVAAVGLLLALTLLALCIHLHPTAASPARLLSRRATNWPTMKFRKQKCQSSYSEVEVGIHEKEGCNELE